MYNEISINIVVLVSLFGLNFLFHVFFAVEVGLEFLFLHHWRHGSCGFNVPLVLFNLNPLQANVVCILAHNSRFDL